MMKTGHHLNNQITNKTTIWHFHSLTSTSRGTKWEMESFRQRMGSMTSIWAKKQNRRAWISKKMNSCNQKWINCSSTRMEAIWHSQMTLQRMKFSDLPVSVRRIWVDLEVQDVWDLYLQSNALAQMCITCISLATFLSSWISKTKRNSLRTANSNWRKSPQLTQALMDLDRIPHKMVYRQKAKKSLNQRMSALILADPTLVRLQKSSLHCNLQ